MTMTIVCLEMLDRNALRANAAPPGFDVALVAHKHALDNYRKRGFEVFKTEQILRQV